MKYRIRAILFLCFWWLITPAYPISAVDDSGLCKISLRSLSKISGVPGDIFEMYGIWGEIQGAKIPCINKGGANKLEVLSWSDSVIKVRIPEHLPTGSYKVGVYCNNPRIGKVASSGWIKFEVIGSGDFKAHNTKVQSKQETRPQKADIRIKTQETKTPPTTKDDSMSPLPDGYTKTLHKFSLGEHRVEGTLLKFEFPDEKINVLYAFNFGEWNVLNEKTDQAVIQLYDSKKALSDEGKSICIKVKQGKSFGSIAFNKINRANVGKVAYFSLTALACTKGQGQLRLKNNPELQPLFEYVLTINNILLPCLETGKSEQVCICSNKSKLGEPIRKAVSFLQKHPELKGKELLLFEESTHHEGGSGKVSISIPLDELPRLQDELKRCR
jgi:hypothetical protein